MKETQQNKYFEFLTQADNVLFSIIRNITELTSVVISYYI